MLNVTLPGRLHLILNRRRVYLVLRLGQRRFELIRPALPRWFWEPPGA